MKNEARRVNSGEVLVVKSNKGKSRLAVVERGRLFFCTMTGKTANGQSGPLILRPARWFVLPEGVLADKCRASVASFLLKRDSERRAQKAQQAEAQEAIDRAVAQKRTEANVERSRSRAAMKHVRALGLPIREWVCVPTKNRYFPALLATGGYETRRFRWGIYYVFPKDLADSAVKGPVFFEGRRKVLSLKVN